MKKRIVFVLLLSYFATNLIAQNNTADSVKTPPKKEWYNSISLRGYAQVRYNRLLETNPKLKCEQCDKSWGENGGFFFRRIRLIFYGNVHKRVYVYIQPDFASAASTTLLNFAQIRDAYFDVALDEKKEFRLRFGQSKVPYGFENMQSSQNRIALDRNDALNSAVSNERDIGVSFLWATTEARERFAYLVKSGLKGSGDYGIFALGAFNGQTANKPESNNQPHIVSRLTYPFKFKNGQYFETSLQAYQGRVGITKTKGNNAPDEFFERRAAASLIVYPQPFGVQAEYTIGVGPEFNTTTMRTENANLKGGYIQLMYYAKAGAQLIIPFVRTQYYNGGKKHEIDARKYRVTEHEIGIEWQPISNFEFVAMYTISNRTFEDYATPLNNQKGNLLRLQAQCNF